MLSNCESVCGSQNPLCVIVGHVGLESFEERRLVCLGSALVLQVLALAMTIYALIAMSSEGRDVESANWAHGTLDTGDLFVGLRMAVFDSDAYAESDIMYNEDQCDSFESLTGQTFCNECEAAGSDAIVCLILSAISILPFAVLSMMRCSFGKDSNALKMYSLITATFAGLVGVIAFGVFGDTCYRNLPPSVQGESVTYSLGPGWYCAVVAFLFITIAAYINALLPVRTHRPAADLAQKLIAKEHSYDGYNF